ncbi:hypothetical protein ACS0TY_006611 [Phlomoides rotata]
MEWYFENDIEDLAVPEDKEIYDRLPSPNSWSSWGNRIGNLNSTEKHNVLGVEELLLSGTMYSGIVEKRSPSNIFQGSRRTFRQRGACPHEYLDDGLNDLPMIDAADDIFFDSIFKVDARALEKAESSANYTQTSSEDDMMATGDLLRGWNHIQDSMDDDENVSHFLSEKELESEISVSEEQTNMCEDSGEEYISMEEPVLLELQNLTMQLAEKTRICFRDSLYRLAENSRNQIKYSWNGEDDLENCESSTRDGPSRVRESKAKNLDTNAIDRTVATLLFDTMKFCNSTAASSSGLNADMLYQVDSHPYHPSSSISSPSNRRGDAEVPTFGWTNQLCS